ncbi:MAG: hypothetical protein NTV70_22745 [Acidobacteria bacterium]|nr:hypothetical protein [Acidobacteriota bacterium]
MTNQQVRDLLGTLSVDPGRLKNVKQDQQPIDSGSADKLGSDLDGNDMVRLLVLAQEGYEAKQREIQQSGSSQTPFDEFLTSLAQSVVATQKKLDRETATYLKEIEGQAHIQPTVFRMPKLEAQMKFGLDVTAGNKLNLLFWGKNSQTVQQNQQGINFEIISVPAPPGAIESARRVVPQWTLIVDPLLRRELVAEIAAAEVKAQTATDPLAPLVNAATASPADVVLVDVGGGTRYLVFYAETAASKDVGIWLLTLAAPGQATKLEPIYRFAKNNGDGEPLMQQLVLELAAKQRTFLGT